MLATDSSMGVLHEGKTVCMKVLLRPIPEGPSKIPPIISATTLG